MNTALQYFLFYHHISLGFNIIRCQNFQHSLEMVYQLEPVQQILVAIVGT